MAYNLSYNITALQSTEYVSDLLVYANNVTGDTFGMIMYISIIFVILLVTLRYGWDTALLTTSFLSFILGLFAISAGIISPWFIAVSLVLFALSWMYHHFTESSQGL